MSPSGVLGDPTGATAAEGRRLFEQMADDVTPESGRPVDRTGRLAPDQPRTAATGAGAGGTGLPREDAGGR